MIKSKLGAFLPLQSDSMVVPDSASVVPHPARSSDLPEGSDPGCPEAGDSDPDLSGMELEEVRKLQELVRRLEIQNETLRTRGAKAAVLKGAVSGGVNINQRLQLRLDRHSGELSGMDSKLSPPQEGSSSEETSPSAVASCLEEEEEEDLGPSCGGFLSLTCRNGAGQPETPESPSQGSCESETLADSDSGVDHTALDEVDVLDLQDECADVEDEDSW